MSLAPNETQQPMSREAYQRWYDAQPSGRFERVDGYVVRMAAERAAHVRMKLEAVLALRRAITVAGLRCQALTDGVRVETGDSDYEPDASVNCGDPMADDAVTIPNPVVVVEVLSPGTAGNDTGGKLAGYFCVPSIQHYLIIHPTRRTVIHHRRNGERIDTQIAVGGSIVMDPPGLTITIEELYEAD